MVEQERQKAEQERQKAEQERQRADRLAEILRSQGIDPDAIAARSLAAWGILASLSFSSSTLSINLNLVQSRSVVAEVAGLPRSITLLKTQ